MRVGKHNPLTEEEEERINEIGKRIILKAYNQSFWDKIEKSPIIIDIKRKVSENYHEYRLYYRIDEKPIYIWINDEGSYWFEPLFYRKTNLTVNNEKKIEGLIIEL